MSPPSDEIEELIDDLTRLNIAFIPVNSDFRFFSLQISLVKTIFSKKAQLIHSHGLTAGLYASFIAKLLNLPHIISIHELLYKEQFKGILKKSIKKKIILMLLSLADKIHLVSNDAKNNLLEYFPNMKKNENKLVPLRNGVDSSRFLNSQSRNLRRELNLPENSYLIGFLGRFMPVKGFRYLADALKIIINDNNTLGKHPILLIFGWNAYIREEMVRAKKIGIEEHIIRLPFVSDVARTIKGLDVIVMPSLSEACGILAMECMVSGVPIIGTSCKGLREVMEDTPNVMVPPANSYALAKAIINEMNYPTRFLAEAFKNKASQRFDVRFQASKLELIISNLIESR
jgi:glycosyltransferase involved in cell wall biosynthesis